MKIELTDPAFMDLENIKDYIKKDSVYYANIFIDKFFDSISKLEDFPNIGRVVPEYKIEDIREIFYKDYRIIYKIDNENNIIHIVAVIHGSRDLINNIRTIDIIS